MPSTITYQNLIFTSQNQNEVSLGNSNNNGGCGHAIGSSGIQSQLRIPSYISNAQYKVTSIMQNAFCYNSVLTSVTIPNTVETIGAAAFSSCKNLKEVIFEGAQLKQIRERVFENCPKLESLIIPKSVESISYGVFAGFSSLSTILYCGNYAFTNPDIISPASGVTNNNLKIFVVHGRYRSSSFGTMRVISTSECLNDPSIRAIYATNHLHHRSLTCLFCIVLSFS